MGSTTFESAGVVAAIEWVVGSSRPVFLHEPRFEGNEQAYLQQCLDSTFVSSVGPFVDRFEADLAAYTGAAHAVVTMNGTAALHLALLLAGVQRNDEVLIPTLTFVATANAVSYLGALPHFCDSEAATLGLDAMALDAHLDAIAERRGGGTFNRHTGRRLAAVVPMHVFGLPLDMAALLRVADKWSLPVVEDAAESLGSYIGDRHTGTFGKLGILSFNGNKVITTGGGGAILTNDPALGKLAKHLSTTARVRHEWAFIHDAVGYNYRMPNLNAALGCAQLEQLPAKLAAKRALADAYRAAFAGTGSEILTESRGSTANQWLVAMRMPAGTTLAERDALLTELAARDIHCRPVWTLMHELPMYEAMPRADLSVALDLERRVLNLPSSPFLAP
jgi:perosamine synthetase